MGPEYSVSNARGLAKGQLGGVIFGTNKTTINECLSKQLFRLPGSHFRYVKKIKPDLPLFLFNYTDRTLHGMFEAASSGQMNIDPFAWISEGSQRTQYPVQLQICSFKGCLDMQFPKSNGIWEAVMSQRVEEMVAKLMESAYENKVNEEENDISCATDDIAVSNGAKKSTLQAVFAIYFPSDEGQMLTLVEYGLLLHRAFLPAQVSLVQV